MTLPVNPHVPINSATIGDYLSQHPENVVALLEVMKLQEMVKILEQVMENSLKNQLKNLKDNREEKHLDLGLHLKQVLSEQKTLLSRLASKLDPQSKLLLSFFQDKHDSSEIKKALIDTLLNYSSISMSSQAHLQSFVNQYASNLTSLIQQQLLVLKNKAQLTPALMAAILSISKKLQIKPPYSVEDLTTLTTTADDFTKLLEELSKGKQLSFEDKQKLLKQFNLFFTQIKQSHDFKSLPPVLQNFVEKTQDHLSNQEEQMTQGTATATQQITEKQKQTIPQATETQDFGPSFGSSAPSSSSIGSSNPTSSSSSTGASSIQGSLPDAFKNLVLDEYMKNQQQFLLELAIDLQSSNIAMDAISSVLNMISDFHSVSTIFNASSILSASKPPWDAAAAQAFNNEKQAAENMFGKDGTGGEVNNAINKIKQEIKDIRDKMNAHPPQMNKETGNSVINDLNNSLKHLKNLQAEGKTYMRFFRAISIKQDPPGSGKYYMYDGNNQLNPTETTSVLNNLSQFENQLKNGPDSPDKIYSDLSSDQTSYQNQGTQQQIQLQMQMTEMQQEWAVVSTSLQMLNQMYMACANAISK